jgi:hypothetical protein
LTVRKTEADLEDVKETKEGPEVINADEKDPKVQALKAKYPKARNIELLPSGLYAVRFLKKRAKYLKGGR